MSQFRARQKQLGHVFSTRHLKFIENLGQDYWNRFMKSVFVTNLQK